jgi:ABC-type oligopeptide transport system ATPase subunit
MGKYIDFIVDYNKNPEDLGRSIIESITINRLKAKKPSIIFITGDSGEGKSYTGINILDIVNKATGVNTINNINDQVIYTPLEYTTKLDSVLFDKNKKKIKVIMIDEARELVKARLWHSFINRAIADCNAMSRRIKPLVLIIVSQFISDIDSDVRKTIMFYGKCARPMKGKTYFTLHRIWKDDRDIEKPKLRKRSLNGYIIKNGVYSIFRPKFRIKMPVKDIVDKYETQNFQAKSKIIRKKLENLMKLLDKEIGHEFDKVKTLVDFYIQKPEMLKMIIERKHNKIKMKKRFKEMHDLTPIEVSEFHTLLLQKLAEKGLAETKEEVEPT